MDIATLIISAFALISPFVATWLAYRKLRPELESLRLQNEDLRAAERRRVRAHVDQVDITTLFFDPWTTDGMTDYASQVSLFFLDHPDPLNVLLARITNRGPYPIRDLFVSANHYVPARASMNGEDPELRVRRIPGELVPLSPGGRALFAFFDPKEQTELDHLAVWFTDEEGRRWKKDVFGIATRVDK